MPEHLWYYYTPKGQPYGKFDWLIKKQKHFTEQGRTTTALAGQFWEH